MSASRTLPVDARVLRSSAWVFALGLLISAVLHLGAVAPYAVWQRLDMELPVTGPEDGAVDGTGTVGEELGTVDHPVQIAVYEEPRSSHRASQPSQPRQPSQQPAASAGPPAGDGNRDQGSDAEQAEHTGSDGQPAALAREGEAGKPPRGNKKPCEPIDEVVQLSSSKWRIERDLLDYYATHLRELDKQAGVVSHRGKDGKKDGAKIYLPRCSILKQGGLRHGDVIHSVNGRKVNTIPQAVTTYMAVRGKKTLTVELTRRNGEKRTHTYKLR